MEVLTNHFFAIFQSQDYRLWSRPVAFQTEIETRLAKMSLETSLETETYTRDSIIATHIWNTMTIMSQERDGINGSHTTSLTLTTWHIREQACWLPCSTGYYVIRMQTRCTISTDVRNSTEANQQIHRLNVVIYNSETKLKVAKKFKKRLSTQNPIRYRVNTP